MPGPNAFPRQERLTRRSEYLRVYREGAKTMGGAFICYVARRSSQGRKIGFAVSRKVGNAVVRNRIKRYLRELYRTHRTLLPDDVHMVVIARPSSADLDFRQCHTELRQLLHRTRTICPPDPGQERSRTE